MDFLNSKPSEEQKKKYWLYSLTVFVVLILGLLGFWASKNSTLFRAFVPPPPPPPCVLSGTCTLIHALTLTSPKGTTFVENEGATPVSGKTINFLVYLSPDATDADKAAFNVWDSKPTLIIKADDSYANKLSCINNGWNNAYADASRGDIPYSEIVVCVLPKAGPVSIWAEYSYDSGGVTQTLTSDTLDLTINGITLSGPSNMKLAESGTLTLTDSVHGSLGTDCYTSWRDNSFFVSNNTNNANDSPVASFGSTNVTVSYIPKIKAGTREFYVYCPNHGYSNTIDITALPASLKLEEVIPNSKYQVGIGYFYLLSGLNSSNATIDTTFDTNINNFVFSDGKTGADKGTFSVGTVPDSKHLRIIYTPKTPSPPYSATPNNLKVTYMGLASNELSVTVLPVPPKSFNVSCPTTIVLGQTVTCNATPVDGLNGSGNRVSYVFKTAAGQGLIVSGNVTPQSGFGSFAQIDKDHDITFSYTPTAGGTETLNVNYSMTTPGTGTNVVISGAKAVPVAPFTLTIDCPQLLFVNAANNCTVTALDGKNTPSVINLNSLYLTENNGQANIAPLFTQIRTATADAQSDSNFTFVYNPNSTGQKTLKASSGAVSVELVRTVDPQPVLNIEQTTPTALRMNEAKNYKVSLFPAGSSASAPFDASKLSIYEEGATPNYNVISNIQPLTGVANNVTFNYTPQSVGLKTLRATDPRAIDGTLSVEPLDIQIAGLANDNWASSITVTATKNGGSIFDYLYIDYGANCDGAIVGWASAITYDNPIVISDTTRNNKDICFRLVSVTGNTIYEKAGHKIQVDVTPPIITITKNASAASVTSDSISLTMNDDESGLAVTKYGFVSSSANCNVSNASVVIGGGTAYDPPADIAITEDHNDYLCLIAVDGVGNTRAAASNQLHVSTGYCAAAARTLEQADALRAYYTYLDINSTGRETTPEELQLYDFDCNNKIEPSDALAIYTTAVNSASNP